MPKKKKKQKEIGTLEPKAKILQGLATPYLQKLFIVKYPQYK
jgi:hypothetical protein